jgi:hypothetical protein
MRGILQARVAMQHSAAQYLAAFWGHTNIYDLFEVQCRYTLTSKKKKRKKKADKRKPSPKGTDADKGAGKDTGALPLLNQRFGLIMAHMFLVREILESNKQIAATLTRNDEIIGKLLDGLSSGNQPWGD